MFNQQTPWARRSGLHGPRRREQRPRPAQKDGPSGREGLEEPFAIHRSLGPAKRLAATGLGQRVVSGICLTATDGAGARQVIS